MGFIKSRLLLIQTKGMPKRTPHNREFDILNFIPDLVSSFIQGTLLKLVVVVKIFSTRKVVILVCVCV